MSQQRLKNISKKIKAKLEKNSKEPMTLDQILKPYYEKLLVNSNYHY
jgi:hypothetical protein